MEAPDSAPDLEWENITERQKVSVELPESVVRDLDMLAQAAAMPRSQYLRLLITGGLKDSDRQHELLLLRAMRKRILVPKPPNTPNTEETTR